MIRTWVNKLVTKRVAVTARFTSCNRRIPKEKFLRKPRWMDAATARPRLTMEKFFCRRRRGFIVLEKTFQTQTNRETGIHVRKEQTLANLTPVPLRNYKSFLRKFCCTLAKRLRSASARSTKTV